MNRFFLLFTIILFLGFSSRTTAQIGLLDSSFAEGGVKRFQFEKFEFDAKNIALLPDGKILVSGRHYGRESFGLVRLEPNGEYDLGFSADTFVSVMPFSDSYFKEFQNFILAPDGNIIWLANYEFENKKMLAVFKTGTHGKPILEFGNGGITLIENIQADKINTLKFDENGRILVSVKQYNPARFGILRLLPNGQPDYDFGNKGLFIYLFVPTFYNLHGTTLGIQADGKIVAASTSYSVSSSNIYITSLARVTEQGIIDSTFGLFGRIKVDSLFIQSEPAFAADGGILLTGTERHKKGLQVLKFLPNGKRDNSFGLNGEASSNLYLGEEGQKIYVQPNGKILVLGVFTIQGDILEVVRFNANGSLDQSFGNKGISFPFMETFYGIKGFAFQSEGKLLLLEDRAYSMGKIVRVNVGATVPIKNTPFPNLPMVVYPNPAGDILFLRTVFQDVSSVQIFDLSGKSISEARASDLARNDVGELWIKIPETAPPGRYWIKALSPGGVQVASFVKI